MRRFILALALFVTTTTEGMSQVDTKLSIGDDGEGMFSVVDKGTYIRTEIGGMLWVFETANDSGPGVVLSPNSGPTGIIQMDEYWPGMGFIVGDYYSMFLDDSARVGIGTSAPTENLHVIGNIKAVGGMEATGTIVAGGNIQATGKVIADSIRVQKVYINNWSIDAPDYVFDESYPLASLEHVESYIKENKHLPDVPSGKQIKEDGIDLAEMNMVLLRKIEELTLYTLAQQKEIEELKAAVKTQHANRN